MKKVILLALFLSACATPKPEVIQVPKLVVISPDPSLMVCDHNGKLPVGATLNDQQVAKTVVSMYQHIETCANNMDAIRSQVAKSQSAVASQK